MALLGEKTAAHVDPAVRHPGVVQVLGDNRRRDQLAVGHDRVGGLLRQIADEIDALEDALELLEQAVYGLQYSHLLVDIVDHGVDHAVVAFHHLGIRVEIADIASNSLTRRCNQLVGNATQSRDYDDDALALCFDDFLDIQNAFYGTYGCSAKLHYLHVVCVLFFLSGSKFRQFMRIYHTKTPKTHFQSFEQQRPEPCRKRGRSAPRHRPQGASTASGPRPAACTKAFV